MTIQAVMTLAQVFGSYALTSTSRITQIPTPLPCIKPTTSCLGQIAYASQYAMCSCTWTHFLAQRTGGEDAFMCCLKTYELLSIVDASPAALSNALRMPRSIFIIFLVPLESIFRRRGCAAVKASVYKSHEFLSKSSSLTFHSHHDIPLSQVQSYLTKH